MTTTLFRTGTVTDRYLDAVAAGGLSPRGGSPGPRPLRT